VIVHVAAWKRGKANWISRREKRRTKQERIRSHTGKGEFQKADVSSLERMQARWGVREELGNDPAKTAYPFVQVPVTIAPGEASGQNVPLKNSLRQKSSNRTQVIVNKREVEKILKTPK